MATAAAPLTPRPIIARGYQLELFQRAYRENIIACLETGAGKTFIAALLIDAVLKDAKAKDASRTSPRVVFLAHRVSLVVQQANALAEQLPEHVVTHYLGPRCARHPLGPNAVRPLPSADALVMTAQLMYNLLSHAHIDLSSLSLLVLDEAHNATKAHPYARIFRDFYHTLNPNSRPRIFAVTATPVKQQRFVREHFRCIRAIAQLEAILDATLVAVSPSSQLEVDSKVPKPHEFVLLYRNRHPRKVRGHEPGSTESSSAPSISSSSAKDSASDSDDEPNVGARESDLDEVTLRRLVMHASAGATLFHASNVTSPRDANNKVRNDPPLLPNQTLPKAELSTVARLHRSLGYTPAVALARFLCASFRVPAAPIESALLADSDNAHISAGGLRDKAAKLLDLLYVEWRFDQSRQHAEVTAAANAAKANTDTTNTQSMDSADVGSTEYPRDEFRAIVFVRERITAMVVSLLINSAFQGVGTSALQARPVVGATINEGAVRMSRADMLGAVTKFRAGEFGILVASNVVEEGIDVPACGLVVAFDGVISSSAYVQARGRARRRDAHYVVFLDEHDERGMLAWQAARMGVNVMDDSAKGAMASEDVRRELREKMFVDTFGHERRLYSSSTSARIGECEAISLLQRYCQIRARICGITDMKEVKFETVFFDDMFTARAKIDERLGVDVVGVCSQPQLREAQSKRIAALDAYEQLYRLGEVDEHLLPACHYAGAACKDSSTDRKSGRTKDRTMDGLVDLSHLTIE